MLTVELLLLTVPGICCASQRERARKSCRNFSAVHKFSFELRSRRPGTGPQNANSRKVLTGGAGKMGVLAGVLAQVLAGRALWETRCQDLCQDSGQHPHFCQHLCQHPLPARFWNSHFWGPVPGRRDLNSNENLCAAENFCNFFVLSLSVKRSKFQGLSKGAQL